MGATRRDILRIAGTAFIAGAAPGAARGTEGEAAVAVDLAQIPEGAVVTVEWQGRPIFVRHRTADEIARARAEPLSAFRDAEADEDRTKRPEWLVLVGLCTHADCIPLANLGPYDGWMCMCHGSVFDLSGRIRAGPARTNLVVPPYRFAGPGLLVIGEEA